MLVLGEKRHCVLCPTGQELVSGLGWGWFELGINKGWELVMVGN